ncbi:MAG: GDSL-type esterase/lipase family protein [Terriglobales bacterium]
MRNPEDGRSVFETMIKMNRRRWMISVLSLLLMTNFGFAQSKRPAAAPELWVGTWASSPQLAAPTDLPPSFSLNDATIRQVVHTSIRGKRIRVRFSNAFGTGPVTFTSAHIAFSAGGSSIRKGSDRELVFSGKPEVTIPAGALTVSDSLDFDLPPMADVAVTVHVQDAPTTITSHPGSRTTTYLVAGDSVSAPQLPETTKIERWYFINGIDVVAPPSAASVVILGDSITDGHGATTNGNDRWPDVLARRLQAEAMPVGVLNQGIGGNRLLRDGIGPNALARFDRDVIAQTGVKWLIVLEGVNDLGTRLHARKTNAGWATADDIIQAYSQMIVRAHAHGIKVYGGTITPFVGSFYSAADEEVDRQKINDWIRTSGNFDGVVDFDKTVRDPAHPDQMLPAYDSGDHLHPSPTGYRTMAQAVPLSIFGARAKITSTPRVAFTFDDLPAHSVLPAGETRMDVASKIITALQEAGVPPTYGFMNGALVEKQPSDQSVLQAWRAAGNPLGNHTWSHMNLNQHTAAEFESDIRRNEPPLAALMKGSDWHWFRFPFLAEGDTQEKRAAVRKFLADNHYKIAAVTMSFGDYQWNEPYARCKDKGDKDAVALLTATYLEAADESIVYSRDMSRTLFNRDIPNVLLMHIGALDAEMLPQLLELYKSRGFQFVSLADAERDQWYRADVDPRLPYTSDTLEGAMAARHLPLPSHTGPAIDFDSICR